jgi:integrase
VAVKLPKTRKRNFVKVGTVKIPWKKSKDGRTFIDLRKWRTTKAQLTFRDHESALAEATRLAIELNAGGAASQVLTPEDRALFTHAVQLIAKEPEPRPSFLQVIEAGLSALRQPVHKTSDIVTRLLASKEKQDLDGRYARDLTQHLTKFAAAFPGSIAAITAAQIETWLDGLRKRNGEPLSPCRRNHVHDDIIHLFTYARSHEMLPIDKKTAPQKVEQLEPEAKEVDVFTPTEMQAILDTVERDWLPYFAIVAFSGARVEEVAKSYHSAKRKDSLRWEDFDWDEREIIIRESVAKGAKKKRKSRRIPLFENLYGFLTDWRDKGAKGPVVVGSIDRFRQRFKRQLAGARFAEAASLAGVDVEEFKRFAAADQKLFLDKCAVTQRLVDKWGNQLRHSYGSYRMAQTKRQKFLVAAEMGNSAEMIEKHYDRRVPRSHGDAWFSIMPTAPNNVIQLHFALLRAPETAVPKRTGFGGRARLPVPPEIPALSEKAQPGAA